MFCLWKCLCFLLNVAKIYVLCWCVPCTFPVRHWYKMTQRKMLSENVKGIQWHFASVQWIAELHQNRRLFSTNGRHMVDCMGIQSCEMAQIWQISVQKYWKVGVNLLRFTRYSWGKDWFERFDLCKIIFATLV